MSTVHIVTKIFNFIHNLHLLYLHDSHINILIAYNSLILTCTFIFLNIFSIFIDGYDKIKNLRFIISFKKYVNSITQKAYNALRCFVVATFCLITVDQKFLHVKSNEICMWYMPCQLKQTHFFITQMIFKICYLFNVQFNINNDLSLTTTPSIGFTDLKLGGTISGVKAAGGSIPLRHLATNHIAKANCSLFNLPFCFTSQSDLKVKIKLQ